MTKQERYDGILSYFAAHDPSPETELLYSSPYELVVAVILSAQCTDKRVNLITPGFFGRFPDYTTLADASEEEVFRFISSCSYPNNKAKHLVGMARTLRDEFGGRMPHDVNELQRMPGVGRKTANVLASVLFNKPAMAVDTHVFRVAARTGLSTRSRTPLETERQLVSHIPEEQVHLAHHWLILHGRYTCTARNPKCHECGIREWCRSFPSITKGIGK